MPGADPDPRSPSARRLSLPEQRLGVVLTGGGVLGLFAALVLTVDRFRLLEDPTTDLGCNISPFVACGPVMVSRAGSLFGFPNPLLGIVAFSVLVTTGVVLLAGLHLPRWYFRGLQPGAVGGAVFLTWLQGQSLYVINTLCLWCILVWVVTIPIVVGVTVHNLEAGHLGRRVVPAGRRLRPYAITVVVVWYLLIAGAIALRFYRDFALLWFGVVL